ncbi:helix-turn-helix domain-containing protein [Primorskyibacter sp. S87]|uniref:AraC family transcriptional regulator n=1 Tax=Primorskyibacter sp. S87 TaxID=3415126 RepID=UPI003C7A0CFB
MPQSIPLIRAASIAPMRRWLREIGHSPEPFLATAGLSWVPEDDPYLPIPLRGVVALLVEISRRIGPDAPCRMVKGRGGYEIGLIGAAALCGPTVREGFQRLARSMPRHCTHEMFVVLDEGDGLHIRDGWAMDMGDTEVLHFVQQYVAALVDMICSVASGASPSADRVEIVPHPTAGLAHLRPWLGDRVLAAKDRALDVVVSNEVAAKQFTDAVQREALLQSEPDGNRLREVNCLSEDVATLVSSMLPRTTPLLEKVAASAGVSSRTLRRHLQEEGTSFSDIVERTRSQIAVDRMQSEPGTPLGDIAAELGYSDQSTLTRMVKRWTGHTPSEFKKTHRVDDHTGNPIGLP